MTASGSGRVKLNPPGTYVPGPDPASWSPDGKQIAFTAYTDTLAGVSAVFVADANGSNRHRITAWGIWMDGANWSPVGNWIEFDNLAPGPRSHNLFLIHPNGTGLKAITSTSLGGVCCAVWSPDGTKLLVAAKGHLITMNRSGSGRRRLTTVDWQNDNFSGGYAWGR
jgi:TolB protein